METETSSPKRKIWSSYKKAGQESRMLMLPQKGLWLILLFMAYLRKGDLQATYTKPNTPKSVCYHIQYLSWIKLFTFFFLWERKAVDDGCHSCLFQFPIREEHYQSFLWADHHYPSMLLLLPFSYLGNKIITPSQKRCNSWIMFNQAFLNLYK